MAERKVLVCDRCDNHSMEFPYHDIKEWGKITLLAGTPPLSQLGKTTDGVADLCPACVKDAMKWWKRGPTPMEQKR